MEGAENEEDEDIEENNEGTAPDDEGAQVIVDLRNNKAGMAAQQYNGAVTLSITLKRIDYLKL